MMLRRLTALAGALLVGVALAGTTATPALAAPPDVYGFAFLHTPLPAPSTVMDPTRQWGTWKTAFPADFATVTRVAVGYYVVRFPHIGVPDDGVVHLTAITDGEPRWCQTLKFYDAGGDEIVEIQCYRIGGVPVDTRLAVMFSAKFSPPATVLGSYAYAHSDAAGNLLSGYDTGLIGVGVSHTSPGRYEVKLPGVGLPSADPAGNVQVTAGDGIKPHRCKVEDWKFFAGGDALVFVLCVDVFNAPADAEFSLTYSRERPVIGDVAPPKRYAYIMTDPPAVWPFTDYNSVGGVNFTMVSGPGQYYIEFRGVGVRETHMQVTAFGSSADWCQLQDVWHINNSIGVVRNVICWNGVGTQKPNPAFDTFTSRV